MKIGVFLEGELTIGGGFQQELTMARLVSERGTAHFEIVIITDSQQNLDVLKQNGMHAVLMHPRVDSGFEELVLSSPSLSRLARKIGLERETRFDRFCIAHGIDLVYFLATSSRSLMLQRTPYVITVWDLCHRDNPEFPEVRRMDKFAKREHVLHTSLPRATAVIADSELGKSNVCRRYGIDPDKVVAVSFQPSRQAIVSDAQYQANFIDIKKRYGIDGNYLFYPAQFWAHKNHAYILEALKILKEKHARTPYALFSGSDRGNLSFVLQRAKELSVDSQIKYIGFVDGKELVYLYRQALALVMPTYFGPTNIPPLEAFANDCPVLYSDLEGMRDQVRGAALLMNLSDPHSLAEGILRILAGGELIESLKREGRNKIRAVSDDVIWEKLFEVYSRAEAKIKTWKVS